MLCHVGRALASSRVHARRRYRLASSAGRREKGQALAGPCGRCSAIGRRSIETTRRSASTRSSPSPTTKGRAAPLWHQRRRPAVSQWAMSRTRARCSGCRCASSSRSRTQGRWVRSVRRCRCRRAPCHGTAAEQALRARLETLLIVAEGSRASELERLRTGPVNLSGRGLQGALERALEVKQLGAGSVQLLDVPAAKVAALARHGLSAKAPKLRELSAQRRVATLLATVRQLETDRQRVAPRPPRAQARRHPTGRAAADNAAQGCAARALGSRRRAGARRQGARG